MNVDDFLEHHGIKGMKWGVRRKGNVRVSSEAKRVSQIRAKAKTHGSHSLTNKELGDYNKRVQLETQYKNLTPTKGAKVKAGHNFVRDILAVGVTVNSAIAFASSPAGKSLAAKFAKKAASEA